MSEWQSLKSLHWFYWSELTPQSQTFELDELSFQHCIHALRHEEGDRVAFTNGNGLLADCELIQVSKRKATAHIQSIYEVPRQVRDISLAISFTKNASRNEWLIEKCTEIGITRIIPLLTDRSEKSKIKPERFHKILVSAMLQSQQCYLPQWADSQSLSTISRQDYSTALIAHCLDESKNSLLSLTINFDTSVLIAIGPEGDFTQEEIKYALADGYEAISLGHTRLRTETAAVVAVSLLQNM